MFQKIELSNIMDEDVEMVPLLSIEEDDNTNSDHLPKVLPILPLRNNVLFPGVVIPISVGREKSIKAVKKAYKENKYIEIVTIIIMQYLFNSSVRSSLSCLCKTKINTFPI